MTHKERLIQLFEDMGIVRDNTKIDKFYNIVGDKQYKEDGDAILLGEGDGYSGFYVKFFFDENGNFVRHGVWE